VVIDAEAGEREYVGRVGEVMTTVAPPRNESLRRADSGHPAGSSEAGRREWRVASAGHLVFAALLIALGIQGLVTRDFTVVWQPVPKGAPARGLLVYLCAGVSLFSGVGLLRRRTARLAAAVLLGLLLLWLLLFRVRALFLASLIEGTWSFGETLVIGSAAWVLFVAFSVNPTGTSSVPFAAGDRGMRIARVLYGLGLIPFGYAHFANLRGTAALVPAPLPGHVFWACFTGATFVAAGAAIVLGVCARFAATLSAVQMGLFGLLVWVPVLAAGSAGAFSWVEFETTVALTAAAWVVADSYRVATAPRVR